MPKEQVLFNFLETFTHNELPCPSYNQMAAFLKCSTQTARNIFRYLAKSGQINVRVIESGQRQMQINGKWSSLSLPTAGPRPVAARAATFHNALRITKNAE